MCELIISTGRSRRETSWRPEKISWEQLAQRLSQTKRTEETAAEYAAMSHEDKGLLKDVGGFVGGEVSGARKNQNVRNRQLLALDIDYGTEDTWEGYTMCCDWECLMHTTHSHTPEKPRYRMYFPLTRPVTREEYEPVARMVASQIDMELFDDTTYQAARLMYWPSTPKDGEFRVWRQSGPMVDPDEILGYYADWHDRSSWPVSGRTTVQIHQAAERQESPYKKSGIVGAFCRTYDVPSAIEKYLPDVYEPVENDERRYTHIGSSTVGGLVLYGDHGSESRAPWVFCYSHHETDEASGMMLNAFDLVRVHKFPQDDSRVGYEKMKSLCSTDEEVRQALEELIHENSTPFGTTDGLDTLVRSDGDYTELGNAIKLKDNNYDVMRYHGSTDWCVWDGKLWQQQAVPEAMMLVMNQTDQLMNDAQRMLQLAEKPENIHSRKTWSEDFEKAMNAYAWAKASKSYNNMANTLRAGRSLMMVRDVDEFDRDPWQLNTPEGIVDLRTGELKAHNAAEMCTMMASESPKNGEHPMFDAFLDRVTAGDKDFRRYLQEVAGMALVGKVYEEGLVIVYGPGGNGKSTLFAVWQTLMGDYAETVRNEVLMGSRSGGEVAGQNLLRGKRLVITSELEESQVMQNSLLKRLTSRDKISANVKYHEPITFTPSHTLILHTNHLPRLRSIDGGIVRRIAVAPFDAVIAPGERVADFAGRLIAAEGPQILRWMVEGAMRFYENDMKLVKPEVVKKATAQYIEGEDLLLQFIEDRCIVDENAREKASTLRDAFFEWAGHQGMNGGINRKSFRGEMEKRGYAYVDMKSGAYVLGLRMRRETDEQFEL